MGRVMPAHEFDAKLDYASLPGLGHGGIVASTFRLLTEAPGADPVAAHLFDCLVRHAARLRTEA